MQASECPIQMCIYTYFNCFIQNWRVAEQQIEVNDHNKMVVHENAVRYASRMAKYTNECIDSPSDEDGISTE